MLLNDVIVHSRSILNLCGERSVLEQTVLHGIDLRERLVLRSSD